MTPPTPVSDLAGRLADLFRETGTAHHRAFSQSDGEDPEWPLWYAEYLHARIAILAGRSFTRSELVYFFVSADREHARQSPRPDWPVFYADLFVQRYA